MTKEIYIIRHGETAFNKDKIVQGSGVDSSLNELGQTQAKRFYDTYKKVGFQKVFVSALKRTFETAKPFIDEGIPFEKDANINEISWGIFEGKPASGKMHQAYSSLLSEWEKGLYKAKIENGESAAELFRRLNVFIEKIKSASETKILVVCHGRAMRCLVCMLEGRDIKFMNEYDHSNTGLYLVEYTDESFVLKLKNDKEHLN